MREWFKRLESWDAQLAGLGVTSDAAKLARENVARAGADSASRATEELHSLLKPRLAARSAALVLDSEPAPEDRASEESLPTEFQWSAGSDVEADPAPAPAMAPELPPTVETGSAGNLDAELGEAASLAAADVGEECDNSVPEQSASLAEPDDEVVIETAGEPSGEEQEVARSPAEGSTPVEAMSAAKVINADADPPVTARESGVQQIVAPESGDSSESGADDAMTLEDGIEFEELLVEECFGEEQVAEMRGSALPPPPPPAAASASDSAVADVDEFSGLMELDARRNLGFGDLTPHMVTPSPDFDSSQTQ